MSNRTVEVSIHSPRRSEGRLYAVAVFEHPAGKMFQSTPPAEARGDVPPRGWGSLAESSRVSIHSPPPKRGETPLDSHTGNRTESEFQSTPPAEARGDHPSTR